MEKIKGVFGGSSGDSDLSPITEVVGGENTSLCPSMSFKDRMIGFGVCTGVGIMLSIGGTINMFFLNYTGKFKYISNFIKFIISAFGVLYSLGTITSLIGTGFLRGPLKPGGRHFQTLSFYDRLPNPTK